MKDAKQLPLTETTYLILLALKDPGHGYAVMQLVEEMSEGRVRIAAGTMYGALETLTRQKLIAAVPSDDARRKVYQTTPEGLALLLAETKRMQQQVALYYNRMEAQEA